MQGPFEHSDAGVIYFELAFSYCKYSVLIEQTKVCKTLKKDKNKLCFNKDCLP